MEKMLEITQTLVQEYKERKRFLPPKMYVRQKNVVLSNTDAPSAEYHREVWGSQKEVWRMGLVTVLVLGVAIGPILTNEG